MKIVQSGGGPVLLYGTVRRPEADFFLIADSSVKIAVSNKKDPERRE